jgi:hypothetical protein
VIQPRHDALCKDSNVRLVRTQRERERERERETHTHTHTKDQKQKEQRIGNFEGEQIQ